MGFFIDEFRSEPHRGSTMSGAPLQVVLRGHWKPMSGTGSEDVTLTVSPGTSHVSPPSFRVAVSEETLFATFIFNIVLSGLDGTFAKVVARSTENEDPMLVEIRS